MSVAQGILAGVQGAQASFRDQRDSNRQREALALSRESQDIATREDRKKTKQENGALNVGKLHLADGADARDYRTQNWEKVATSLDGNQAMAALGNQVEGWRKFTPFFEIHRERRGDGGDCLHPNDEAHRYRRYRTYDRGPYRSGR